jgi:putative ABC transport system substrate-binding protein
MGNPVRAGLVASLARPGGNLTGLSTFDAGGVAGKWLELLHEAVPKLSTVAVIGNPDHPLNRGAAKRLEPIAQTRGLKLRLIEVREPGALNHAFEQARREAQAVLVLPDTVISTHLAEVAALAAKHRLPTFYYSRDFVDAGGLMAYTPDLAVQFQRAADYVDKILKGAKPGDLNRPGFSGDLSA